MSNHSAEVSVTRVLPGWERHWDESRDLPYYVHVASGRTEWSLDDVAENGAHMERPFTHSMELQPPQTTPLPVDTSGSSAAAAAAAEPSSRVESHVDNGSSHGRLVSVSAGSAVSATDSVLGLEFVPLPWVFRLHAAPSVKWHRLAWGIPACVLLLVVYFVVMRPWEATCLTESQLSKGDSNCPARICTGFYLYTLLSFSVLNASVRPFRRRTVMLTYIIPLLLLVVQLSVFLAWRSTVDVSSGSESVTGGIVEDTKDTGLCSYVESAELVGACVIRNEFVFIPNEWREFVGLAPLGDPSSPSSIPASAPSDLTYSTHGMCPPGYFSLFENVAGEAAAGAVSRMFSLIENSLLPLAGISDPACMAAILDFACTSFIPRCTSECQLIAAPVAKCTDLFRACNVTSFVSLSDGFDRVLNPVSNFEWQFIYGPGGIMQRNNVPWGAAGAMLYGARYCGVAHSPLANSSMFTCFPRSSGTNVSAGAYVMPGTTPFPYGGLRRVIPPTDETVRVQLGGNVSGPVKPPGTCNVTSQTRRSSEYAPVEAITLLLTAAVLVVVWVQDILLEPVVHSHVTDDFEQKDKKASGQESSSDGRSSCTAPAAYIVTQDNEVDIDTLTRYALWDRASFSAVAEVISWDGITLSICGVLLCVCLLYVAVVQSTFSYAIAFYTLAFVSMVLSITDVFWFSSYHLTLPVRNTVTNCLLKYAGRECVSLWQSIRFGGSRYAVRLLAMELVEWAAQLLNISTLESSVDSLVFVGLASILGINIVISSVALSSRNRACSNEGAAIVDLFFDLVFFFFTLYARPIPELSALASFLLIVPSLLSLQSMYSLVRLLEHARFRLSSLFMEVYGQATPAVGDTVNPKGDTGRRRGSISVLSVRRYMESTGESSPAPEQQPPPQPDAAFVNEEEEEEKEEDQQRLPNLPVSSSIELGTMPPTAPDHGNGTDGGARGLSRSSEDDDDDDDEEQLDAIMGGAVPFNRKQTSNIPYTNSAYSGTGSGDGLQQPQPQHRPAHVASRAQAMAKRPAKQPAQLLPRVWRRYHIGLAISAVGVALGMALLISTIVRVVEQQQVCEQLVGASVWSSTSPKAYFEDGFWAPTGCGFRHVTSLNVDGDTSVDTARLMLLAQHYTALRSLSVRRCSVTDLSLDVFLDGRLSHLTTLDLRDNPLTYVAPQVFVTGSTALTTLYLDGTSFATTVSWNTHVPPVSASTLSPLFMAAVAPHVQELQMQQHALTTVPYEYLRSMPRLLVADLSRGALVDWPDEDSDAYTSRFLGAPRLLNLSSNSMTSVPTLLSFTTWSAPEVLVLDLRGNRLTALTPALVGLTGTLLMDTDVDIEQVNLDSSGLAYLNPTLFSLHNIRELWLNRNGAITEIPCLIGKLTRLIRLEIRYLNKLTALPTEMGRLTSLQTYWGYDTGLTAFPTEMFNENSTVEDITVHNSPLAVWPRFPRLRTANMLNTKLTAIPSNIGDGSYTRLRDLEISPLLTSIPSELALVSTLRRLLLCGNTALTTLPSQLVNLANLTVLNVQGTAINVSALPARLQEVINSTDPQLEYCATGRDSRSGIG